MTEGSRLSVGAHGSAHHPGWANRVTVGHVPVAGSTFRLVHGGTGSRRLRRHGHALRAGRRSPGALVGVVADRLASRWPAHPDGSVRPVDWRTAAVVLGGAAALAVSSRAGTTLATSWCWDRHRGAHRAARDRPRPAAAARPHHAAAHRLYGEHRSWPQSGPRRKGLAQPACSLRSSHPLFLAVTDKMFRGASGWAT